MSVKDDLEFVRAAMRTGILISPEVCWTLAPLLDALEKRLDGAATTEITKCRKGHDHAERPTRKP